MIALEDVKRSIAEQFPNLRRLEVKKLAYQGNDHSSFLLGDDLLVRIPNKQCYTGQVSKEQTWLKVFAKHLKFKVSNPLYHGKKDAHLPWDWSIYQWIEGTCGNSITLSEHDQIQCASDLAEFILELHQIPYKKCSSCRFAQFLPRGSS